MEATKSSELHPFVKWAGGKKQLLPEIKKRLPDSFKHYFEPFVGGGAVVLALQPKHAVINDVNPQLTNVYTQLKNNASAVIDTLKTYQNEDCDRTEYNRMREQYNEKIYNEILDAESAAMTIWINKHCFNGIYRVNSKGGFNVPFNNATTFTIDEDNLLQIGKYLKKSKVTIKNEDFMSNCMYTKPGDFIYFDPPYVPMSGTANFTSYTKDGFANNDHIRLAEMCRWLDMRGVKFMVSNNDTPMVRKLYDGFDIESVEVNRSINSKGGKRKSTEVIIRNY